MPGQVNTDTEPTTQLDTEILRLGWASFCCETMKLNPTPPNHHHKYLYHQTLPQSYLTPIFIPQILNIPQQSPN